MPFKDIFYLELWRPFCLAERNQLCNYTRGPNVEHFDFRPVVQKDISYLELWQTFCSAEQNHLCNFGRVHHGEHL